MSEWSPNLRSVTYMLRHDQTLPRQVTFYDKDNRYKKWVRAQFIYEDKRRFHKTMTFEEFITALRRESRFCLWTQGEGPTERIWVSMA